MNIKLEIMALAQVIYSTNGSSPYADIMKTAEIILGMSDQQAQSCYERMKVRLETEDVPHSHVGILWQIAHKALMAKDRQDFFGLVNGPKEKADILIENVKVKEQPI